MHELANKIVSIAVGLGLLDEPCPIEPHAFHYSQSFDNSWSRVPDIARAKNFLDFRPSLSLSEGLKVTLTYYGNLINRPASAQTALHVGA